MRPFRSQRGSVPKSGGVRSRKNSGKTLSRPVSLIQDDSGRTMWRTTAWQQAHKGSDGKAICVAAFTKDQLRNWTVKALERPDIFEKVQKQWPGASYETVDWMRAENHLC